jgi:hypothetical protein
LAYLADIFNNMNEISLSIQGPEVTIMDPTEILQTFLANFVFCNYTVCVQLRLLFTHCFSLLTLHILT